MWTKLALFWNTELWSFRLEDIPGRLKYWYKALRVLSYSVTRFYKDGCALRASSLTYYTLMSIVPALALAFSIARGFNLQEPLKEQLLHNFEEHKAALSEIIFFADRLIEETRGGIVAGFGIVVLIWSAVSLIGSMEAAVNHIWRVPKMRSWRRIVGEYVALLLIAPILFVLSNSLAVFVSSYLEQLFQRLPLATALVAFFHISAHLLSYALFWIFFSFLYYFLPNTDIKLPAAFLGGIVAGTLYLFAQWAYFFFQIGVSSYGAIYGSFAALPLFLIWVQLSWFIFLFGAEVGYAYQSLEVHEFEDELEKASPKFKKMLSLWMLQIIVQRFEKNFEPMSQALLIKKCRLPSAVAIPLLNKLVLCGLLTEVKSDEIAYLPGRPIEQLRIFDALQAIENHGLSELPFIHSRELIRLEKIFHFFTEKIEESPENRLLKDLKTGAD